MKTATFETLPSLAGQEIGVSDWVEITQDRINKFADATGDHQWIHVDVERAKKEMPGGKTIAHGYLTLSLIPWLTGRQQGARGDPPAERKKAPGGDSSSERKKASGEDSPSNRRRK